MKLYVYTANFTELYSWAVVCRCLVIAIAYDGTELHSLDGTILDDLYSSLPTDTYFLPSWELPSQRLDMLKQGA